MPAWPTSRLDVFAWPLLAAELRHWSREGRRPQLWWRDDDAQALTPALVELLACVTRDAIPLALAVIPEGADPSLAVFLRTQPLVCVMQHGLDHVNAGPPSRPAQFAPEAPVAQVAARLRRGWAQLAAFDRRLPVYVPPWNSLQPNVLAALEPAGLQGVSAWAGPPGPGRMDTHLDLLRWQPRPRFVGRGKFLGRLRRALARRRLQGRWDEPVGLLTHHLDHDRAAWTFLADLLAFAPLRDIADWREPGELFGLNPLRANPGPAPAAQLASSQG